MSLNEAERVFSDTDNPYILMANKMGIVNGTSAASNGKLATFSPKASITREEVPSVLRA